MNKTCARCEKTVYPTEELKCLDKVWHKGCFKCQECGMTLNMRTYKGYGKLPYCEAHVPKAKHTTMAETPELRRIAENTKLQSNVKYHADFEKSKGKFTQVADDPETLRIKANTKIISNVAYHGDLEKKAQMEKQRQINENGELVDVPTDYHQQIESYATEMLPPAAPPSLPLKNHHQLPAQGPPQAPPHQLQHQAHHNQSHQNQAHLNQVHQSQTHQNQAHNQIHQHQAQNQVHQNQAQNQVHQNQAQNQIHQNQAHNQNQNRQYDPYYKKYDEYHNQNQQYAYDEYQNQLGYGYQNYPAAQPKIGRIQDYDPVSDGPRAPPNTQRSSSTLIYNSTSDGKRGTHQSQQQQQSRQIGRVTDMDPLAVEQPQNHHQTQQVVYVAMYDYEANDSDEVSFREGDYISNVTSVDSGWMTGQVLRTGRSGMLPANYVERLAAAPANY